MNYKVSFQELAKIQKEILSKQQPTILEKASRDSQEIELSKDQETTRLISWIDQSGL